MTAQPSHQPKRLGPSPSTETTARSPRRFICFAWALLAVGLCVVAWSLASPVGGAPDEPDQVANAAAVVRGQFDVRAPSRPVGQLPLVQIPLWVQQVNHSPLCFAFKSSVPASCAPPVTAADKTVAMSTQFSNYPPLYFLVVGLPTLWMTGTHAFFGMRMLGDLLNGALLALGLFLLACFHPRRLPLVGALVALSPTVFFMASVVNDSGFEIAAAFAAWCGGVALATHDRAPRALVYWTALALGLLLLARPLSLVNSAVLVVSLALLAGRHRLQALLGRSDVRHAMVALCIPLAIALAWLAVSGLPTLLGSPLKPQLTMVGSVEYSLRLVNQRLFQCIGDFGWLDTPSPLVTTVLWITAVGALTVAGLALSKACRRSLCFLIPAILAVNLVVEAPRLNALGPFWQGRYWLPIVMGVPLVAASLGHSRAHGRVRRPVVGAIATLAAGSVLAVGQIAAFLTALHRYETGLGARPGTPLRWVPPGGTVLVVTLMVTGTALLVAFATRYALATGSPPRSDAPGGPDPGSRHRGQAALAEA